MKKIIAMIIVALVPAFLLAQGTPFSVLFNEFVSVPGFETREIRPAETSFEWEKTMDASHFRDAVSQVESIRILEYKGEGKISREKLWKKFLKASDHGSYTQVIQVNADNAEASVYMTKEHGGKIGEIALIAKEQDKILMVSVTGDLDFRKMFDPETMKSLRELGKYHMKGKDGCEVN